MPNRLPIPARFHLPDLHDDDLSEAVRWVRHCYDWAPRFAAWLLDELLDEQTRRLASRDGVPRESTLLALPSNGWSGSELVEGLTVLTGLSYGVRNEAVGRMIDKLVWLFTAVVGARLAALEKRHDAQNATR